MKNYFMGVRHVGHNCCPADFTNASMHVWQSVCPQVNMRGHRVLSSNCSMQMLHCNTLADILLSHPHAHKQVPFSQIHIQCNAEVLCGTVTATAARSIILIPVAGAREYLFETEKQFSCGLLVRAKNCKARKLQTRRDHRSQVDGRSRQSWWR